MRHHFIPALLLCALLPAVAGAQAPKPRQIIAIDRIVAVVNSEVITERELSARVDFALRQLREQKAPAPPRAVLEGQLLERLINDRVQMQHARDIGLRVSDAELDRS